MEKMKEVLIAAMKNKKSTGDSDQKNTARGLQDAMERARKKFLSEHPEAAKRPFGKEKPSKKEQDKEAKKRRKEVRKDSMSSKNNFSMDYVEEANFSNVGWYQRKGIADFARTKGAKDKQPRKKKGRGRVAKIALGSLAGIIAGRAGGKKLATMLAKRKGLPLDSLTRAGHLGSEIGNVGGAISGAGLTALATKKKKNKKD